MTLIALRRVDGGAPDPWPAIVESAAGWLAETGADARDAIVLVPFAQHLPLARRAWAARGGWMPRIETTQSLARALAPPPAAGELGITFDAAIDRLTARRLLRGVQRTAALRRDPRAFEQAGAAVVATAHAFARAVAALPAAERAANRERGRELLGGAAGPGQTERVLAQVAFEWAAAADAAATDLLFDLAPSAWIAVEAGGAAALTANLLRAAAGARPCLRIVTDPDPEQPFAGTVHTGRVALAECDDFEDEAVRSAAHVIQHLNEGRTPVALIAQDRLLTRRVRALLARQRVPLADETGWRLSTTRAGASVATLLRAARWNASVDDWLDWLKPTVVAWPGLERSVRALDELEAALRRNGWVAPAAVDAAKLDAAAAALHEAAAAILAALRAAPRLSLRGWLAALKQALVACGSWQLLSDDDAGRQLLAAVPIDDPERIGAGVLDESMSLDDFSRWIDATLEDASFVPAADADAQVVVTPLERAMLRPFGAIVLPGADEKRLGAAPAPHPLLSDAVALELGLATAEQRRQAEVLAFAQILRVPALTLLRRRDDGGEPLAPSPLIERLGLALAAAGRTLEEAADPTHAETVEPAPVARPQPRAPALLPLRLSATATDALRTCPYRFFTLQMLQLADADELDDEVEKRDYGNWLHDVLRRFHAERGAGASVADDTRRLHEVARVVEREMGLDAAAFLPFAASFARLVPRYVRWLHERDAAGAEWQQGEVELTVRPPAWGGVEMRGVVDRIDRLADGTTELIDYKTTSPKTLRERTGAGRRFEDTQLAFYAALAGGQHDEAPPLRAIYLAVDSGEDVQEALHADVATSARAVVEGVGAELERIRAGAPLPALGRGTACEYCSARGICRRDDWPAEALVA
ncbi:PD-(D/E)XK nuclease family protein [Piscinibacter koreensis]|uniref:PD-(D/E)XK nuclease family protein n=1 Tax=Piscinibacter koreensis TaxID=2742824 RepID=A0A7Y6NQZ7_9BURK|nr:PD-(D/E)XK nuclease family protein [Schlegelella koreensis]NUZ07737.1 PD-(D/E)XK nuclease family protein [Schlegelella koreensis]